MLIAIPAIFTVPAGNSGYRAEYEKERRRGKRKERWRVTEERSVTDSRTTNGTEDRELLEEEPGVLLRSLSFLPSSLFVATTFYQIQG